jgi:hypothetical protein
VGDFMQQDIGMKRHALIQFLRCVSRSKLGEQEAEFIKRFCQEEVPWGSLAMVAQMEGVAGFLYLHLKALGLLKNIPGYLIHQIEASYQKTVQHTFEIIHEMRGLSERLEETGIHVVGLQGLSLLSLYRDPGIRFMGDVDLMVQPRHKERFNSLLRESGYQCLLPEYPDILYKKGIKIDIHTHVLNLDRIGHRKYIFPQDLTAMWERGIPLFDQSAGLLVLEPYDNFIALAAHALKHSYSMIIWLVDLHEFLLKWAHNNNGWGKIIERAQFWHQEKVVLYALILVEKIFELEVPLWVKQDLEIQRLTILEKHLLRLKFRGFSSNELCIGLWLCNIKGAGRKFKFMKEMMFPRNEIMTQLFDQGSQATKKSIYLKRAMDIIVKLGENVHQVLHLGFKLGGDE